MTRLAILLAMVVGATEATAPLPARQGPVFKTGIEIVELDVSVMRGGQPVIGLAAGDFAVTDEGVAQEIDSVTLDTLPLSVIVALDTSGSVSGDRLRHLLDAGDALARALRSDDRVALITFSHAIDLRVPLTGDMNAIRVALHAITPGGSTALRDAVQLALAFRPRDRPHLHAARREEGRLACAESEIEKRKRRRHGPARLLRRDAFIVAVASSF